MPQTLQQQVSAEADRYVQAVAMWGVKDDAEMWDAWKAMHKLDPEIARRVRLVLDAVYA